MSETTTSQPPLSASTHSGVRLGGRILTYVAVWLFAALIIVLIPDSDFTTSEQLMSAVCAPLVAVFGLALIVTYPAQPSALTSALAAMLLVAHAIITLTRTRRQPFTAMIGLQLLTLTIAAFYLVRFSRLPSGG
jgi:hypothetical protein